MSLFLLRLCPVFNLKCENASTKQQRKKKKKSPNKSPQKFCHHTASLWLSFWICRRLLSIFVRRQWTHRQSAFVNLTSRVQIQARLVYIPPQPSTFFSVLWRPKHSDTQSSTFSLCARECVSLCAWTRECEFSREEHSLSTRVTLVARLNLPHKEAQIANGRVRSGRTGAQRFLTRSKKSTRRKNWIK